MKLELRSLVAGVAIGALLVVGVLAAVSLRLLGDGRGVLCTRGILCHETSGATGVMTPQQVHLALPQDPTRSLAVTWVSAGAATGPRLELREADMSGWRVAPARSERIPSAGRLRHRGWLHHASVDGLRPGIDYEYRVAHVDHEGAVHHSEIFAARTLPERGAGPVRIGFVSDTGMSGRIDGLADGAVAIRRLLAEDAPHLVLGGGDYAYANWDGRFIFPEDAIDEWFREWQPVLARIPLVPQWGNHECCLEESTDLWVPRFQLPPTSAPDGLSYSFDLHSMHVVGYYATGKRPPDPDVVAWLDADLAAARAAGSRWIVVFQHEPIFGHGESHPAKPRIRVALAPVLERHDVDLHLSAHDQSYERTFPLVDVSRDGFEVASRELHDYARSTGVIYAKVSPSGKRSELTGGFSYLPAVPPPMIAVSDDTSHHYAELTLSAAGDELAYVAWGVGADGSRTVRDRFVIRGD